MTMATKNTQNEAPPGPGHNSTGGLAAERLRSFIERVERMEEEKKNIGADIRDIYAEAKSCGFDAKTMRKIVVIRKLDLAERQEQEALIDTYLRALGDVLA